jgi:hypothetical protein
VVRAAGWAAARAAAARAADVAAGPRAAWRAGSCRAEREAVSSGFGLCT